MEDSQAKGQDCLKGELGRDLWGGSHQRPVPFLNWETLEVTGPGLE